MGMIYRPKYKDKIGQHRQSAVWWIKYYQNGAAVRESAGTEREKEAINLLRQREGDVARGATIVPKAGRIRFDELMEDLKVEYEVNRRRSKEDLKRRIDLHLIPYFGVGRRAASITTADINRYITTRRGEGAANATINRELAAIKRAFSIAMKGGKLLSRPYIPMLQEDNVRTGFFEKEQFEAVLRRLRDGEVKTLLRFAYITGWRLRSEILTLQWAQVDFNAGIVRLEPGTTKNKQGREFPFTAELRDILEAQREKSKLLQKKRGTICPWVFNRNGRQVKSFKHAWKTASEKAALPWAIPHDFRRTAVRNLVRAGIPERVAMMLTGHKTRSVFERYNIVSQGDLFEAAKKLDSVSEKAQPKIPTTPRLHS
jgi:integrase